MASRPTTPPAAPTQGAAQREVLAATMARLDALLAPTGPAAAVQRRRSYEVSAPAASALDEPATDPGRWAGFL